MLHEQLLKYTLYNLWANARIMDFVTNAGEDNADVECQSSFPTIRKTIYHIYDAEWVWMLRINKQPLGDWPPSRDFNFPLDKFRETWAAQSTEIIDFVRSSDEKKLAVNLDYTNTKGEKFTSRLSDVIMHCMNHSTYHRGQVITMLRTTGFTDVASTDFITFCREK